MLLSRLQTAFQQDSLAGHSHVLMAFLSLARHSTCQGFLLGKTWHNVTRPTFQLTQTHYSVALTEALHPL